MVIDNSANLVIDNASANAITTMGTGGNIVSEDENDVVKWNIGTNIGNYTVPFTTSSHVKIPLAVNITGAGIGSGYLVFATFETNNDNNITYPSEVTNMLGANGDNSLFTVDRFWRIEATNYTSKPTPTISFGYDDAANEIGGTNTITESKLKAQRYNVGTNSWETPQFLFGTANAATNQVQNSTITATDFYTWWSLLDTSSTDLLPMELMSFDATLNKEERVLLRWETATEIDNDYFSIERSRDAINWELIKKIDGADNSFTTLTYLTIDDSPLTGRSYYKLKQTDINGSESYSDIKTVFLDKSPITQISVFPNPATDIVTLADDNPSELKQIKIYDVIGQELTSSIKIVHRERNQVRIDLSLLSSGIYTIVTESGSSKIHKINR